MEVDIGTPPAQSGAMGLSAAIRGELYVRFTDPQRLPPFPQRPSGLAAISSPTGHRGSPDDGEAADVISSSQDAAAGSAAGRPGILSSLKRAMGGGAPPPCAASITNTAPTTPHTRPPAPPHSGQRGH